jgi:hypothetical protein
LPSLTVRRENRHHRADATAIGGQSEVIDTRLEDFLRRLVITAIADDQRLPWQAANAPGTGAPSHPAGMLELVEMHGVLAVAADRRDYFFPTDAVGGLVDDFFPKQ